MILAGLMGAFVLGSCVDDNESASVTAVREAKAYQLKAMGDYYKAQGEALKIQAEAEAAYKAALAEYNKALAAAELAKKDKTAAEIAQIEQEMAQAKEKFAIELEAAKAKAEAEIAKAKAEAIAAEQSIIDAANARVQQLYYIYAQAADQLYDLMDQKTGKTFNLARLDANLVTVKNWIAEKTADLQANIAANEAKIETWKTYAGYDGGELKAEFDANVQKKYGLYKNQEEAFKALTPAREAFIAAVNPYFAWGGYTITRANAQGFSSVAAVAAIQKVQILTRELGSFASGNVQDAIDLGLIDVEDYNLIINFNDGSVSTINEEKSLIEVYVNGVNMPAQVYTHTDVELTEDGLSVPLYAYNKYAMPYADAKIKGEDPSATIEAAKENIKNAEESIAFWETRIEKSNTELEAKTADLETANAAVEAAQPAVDAAEAEVEKAQQDIAERNNKYRKDYDAEWDAYSDLNDKDDELLTAINGLWTVRNRLEAELNNQETLLTLYKGYWGLYTVSEGSVEIHGLDYYKQNKQLAESDKAIFEQNLEDNEATLEQFNTYLTEAEEALKKNGEDIAAKELEFANAADADKPGIKDEIDALKAQTEVLESNVNQWKQNVKKAEEWVKDSKEQIAKAQERIDKETANITKTEAKIESIETKKTELTTAIQAQAEKIAAFEQQREDLAWYENYIAFVEKVEALRLEWETDNAELKIPLRAAQNKLTEANSILSNAQSEASRIQRSIDVTNRMIAISENNIATQKLNIDKANIAIAKAEEEIANHDALVAAWDEFAAALNDAYKTEVEGLKDNEAVLAYVKAKKAYADAQKEYNDLITRQGVLAQLLNSDDVKNPQDEIDALQAEIDGWNKKIAALPASFENGDSKELIESQMAELQAELELLETKIAEQQIRVNQCKAALDAAIAALPATE